MKWIQQYPVLVKSIPLVLASWTLLTLYLTLMPADSLPDAKAFSYDKIGHFGMFGGWTGLLGMYFLYYRKNLEVNLVLITILGILFGATMEFLQLVLPINRVFSWYDILANTIGAITAFYVLSYMRASIKIT